MAIKNSVSNNYLSTFIDSINVFDCCLSGVRARGELFSTSILCVCEK